MEKAQGKADALTAFAKLHITLDAPKSPSASMVGEFKLTKLLGKGSFGHVYLGTFSHGTNLSHRQGGPDGGGQGTATLGHRREGPPKDLQRDPHSPGRPPRKRGRSS